MFVDQSPVQFPAQSPPGDEPSLKTGVRRVKVNNRGPDSSPIASSSAKQRHTSTRTYMSRQHD
jgi:hypothetical protein